jgi:DNA-binding transcriptional LysR family regulator
MARFVSGERARLVIGLDPSTLYARLPEVIRRFREMSPNVDLCLTRMPSVDQISALMEGSINVGLGRVSLNAPGIRQKVLREERLIVAIPHGHPLASDAADSIPTTSLLRLFLLISHGLRLMAAGRHAFGLMFARAPRNTLRRIVVIDPLW